jgi:hypothetical protein
VLVLVLVRALALAQAPAAGSGIAQPAALQEAWVAQGPVR